MSQIAKHTLTQRPENPGVCLVPNTEPRSREEPRCQCAESVTTSGRASGRQVLQDEMA